jgi:putative flippase GtrA
MTGQSAFARWLAFNGVGVLGVGVQLGTVALLIRSAGVHYLLATAIAVEAAVLHNFAWHQRWTWGDRPSATYRTTLDRLRRFHLLNGAVSLAGNVGLTSVLSGGLRMDPVHANIAAILACSVVNFLASEVLVFRGLDPQNVDDLSQVSRVKTVPASAGRYQECDLARRSLVGLRRSLARTASVVALAAVGTFSQPVGTYAADLEAELTAAAVAGWQHYERQIDERYDRAAAASDPYFAQDAYKENARTQPGWRQRVMAGQISMVRIASAAPGTAESSIPDARVHHWAGAVFIPNASVDRTIRHLKDRAGRESESFEDVVASKLLSRDGDRMRIYMKLRRDSVITVTYNTEHAIEYRRLGNARASSRSRSTKIAELVDAGTPRERERPAGSDRGFLWRLNAYWRFEEIKGGVLIECESVSLSRSVPALLRPFISGVVEGIARESLEKTLVGLRSELTRAVTSAHAGQPGR